MRHLHSIAIWTAALSAAIAAGRIVSLLSGANPRTSVQIGAEAAATTVAAVLLISALVVYLLARRRLRLAPGGATRKLPAADCAACLHKRREVLEHRLNVDEPRLCSQYMIACTAWSFCVGSEGKTPTAEVAAPAAAQFILVRKIVPEAKGLPLVQRKGMDSCPFRFTSPYAWVSTH